MSPLHHNHLTRHLDAALEQEAPGMRGRQAAVALEAQTVHQRHAEKGNDIVMFGMAPPRVAWRGTFPLIHLNPSGVEADGQFHRFSS